MLTQRSGSRWIPGGMWAIIALFFIVAPLQPQQKPFTDITDQAGVRHRHYKPVLDEKLDNIMPWMASVGAAAAAADYDNDGDIDLYVTNSRLGYPNALYRNNGDMTFTDVAQEVGVASANEEYGTSMDAVWGDYDNDGNLDLYVVKWGCNILYHNNSDGTFTDVTQKSGVRDCGNGNAAVWVDYNDDSYPDLYVGNYFRYVDLWNLENAMVMHCDFETARDAGPNVFYRNNGDGTFTDVSYELGVADSGWTLDIGCADYDNDGDMDIINANDFGQDKVYRNNDDGSFTDVTSGAIGYDTHKGMNVDFGDYNNDGFLDLYVSNIYTQEYVQEGNQLYRNNGDGTYMDVSFETETYDGGWSWGAKFWDLDNDGDLDLMNACGYISGGEGEYFTDLAIAVTQPGFDPTNAASWPTIGDKTFSGYQPSRVWRNEGSEVFKEVAAEIGLNDIGDGRGLAIADYDNDGDLDVFITNQGQDAVLYRNDIGNRKNWLELELRGSASNHFVIGARVKVTSGDLTQIREVEGGNAGHCQCGYRLHFGLGERDKIDRVEIRWPCGYNQELTDVAVNQILMVGEKVPPEFLEEKRKMAEIEKVSGKMWESTSLNNDPTTVREAVDWDEIGEFKRAFIDLKAELTANPENPETYYQLGLLLDKAGRMDEALNHLEQAVAFDPEDLDYGNTYRFRIRAYGHKYFDRSIHFFEDLVEKHPNVIMVRLNKALSYVDKMPYPRLGIVRQGILSNQSIAELDEILTIDPDCWAARYIRAMNHLHWPRKLDHAPLAIEDFKKLIALQNSWGPEAQEDYFAYSYAAMGDAYVKNRDVDYEGMIFKARETWEEGLKRFPNSPDLKIRLSMTGDEELITFIKKLRGLEDPVDTDLSLIWMEKE